MVWVIHDPPHPRRGGVVLFGTFSPKLRVHSHGCTFIRAPKIAFQIPMVYNSYQNHGIQPSKPWCSHPRYHEMPKIPKIIAKKSSSRVIFWHQKSIIGHQFRLRMNHPGHDSHISPRLWCPHAVRSLGNSAPAMPGGAPSPAVPPGGGGLGGPSPPGAAPHHGCLEYFLLTK